MRLHVFAVEHLVNEHQSADHVPDRCALWRVGNPRMLNAGSVQPEEVLILSEDNSALSSCAFQVYFVLRTHQTSFYGG